MEGSERGPLSRAGMPGSTDRKPGRNKQADRENKRQGTQEYGIPFSIS